MLIAQIEDAEAVSRLDEILAVDGIDVFDIGTGDLANSLGYPGEPAHPEVVKVIDQIVARANAKGRITSNPGNDLAAMAHYFKQGARCFLLGDGRMFFKAVRQSIKEIQDVLGERKA
jgi:2-keto-3-deoxy-L-rhamnonate aldolase RhmA